MDNKYSIKTFYIAQDYQGIFEVLKQYCEENNVSQSYVICEAVMEFLRKEWEKEVEKLKKV